LTNCILSVPDRKLFDLQELISSVLQNCCKIRARTLAKVCGKIIAMSPALGDCGSNFKNITLPK
jgi:hypothetical protein